MGFDDAGSATVVDAFYALRVVQVGVHRRSGVQKPGADQFGSAGGVGFVAGDVVAKGERVAEPNFYAS